MINFAHCHDKIQVFDDYYTPYYVWEQINHLIPKDKIIWEAFKRYSESQRQYCDFLRITSSNQTLDSSNERS